MASYIPVPYYSGGGGGSYLPVNNPAFTGQETGPTGSAAAPTYSFTGHTGYGWYYDTTNNTLAAATGGVETAQLTTLGTGTAFQSQLILGTSGHAGSIQLNSNAFLSDAGPSISFSNIGRTAYATIYALNLYSASGSIEITSAVAGTSTIGFQDGGTGSVVGGLTYVGAGSQRIALNADNSPATTGVLYMGVPSVSKTASYTCLVTDSGAAFDNRGATGAITFTLPTIATAGVGTCYTFTTCAAFAVTVSAADGFYYGTKNGAAATFVSSAAIGNSITVVAQTAGWKVTALVGSWT